MISESAHAANGDLLTVEFIGERHVVRAGEALTFGRRADLVIDDNPFLHRVAGRFAFREGFWWLQNHGSRSTLEVIEGDPPVHSVLAPQQQRPLVAPSMVVRFCAGPTTYELDVLLEGNENWTLSIAEPHGTATIDFGVVPLTDEQHLLLVVLCEHRLLGLSSMPSNGDMAARLDWTPKKFNRKLDNICAKYARCGVRGLVGEPGALASDRREALVDHVLAAQLVTSGDLGMLPGSM